MKKFKRYNGHVFPRTEEYFFMDGRRYAFVGVTDAHLSTWQHLTLDDGSTVIVNPDNVKFVRVTWS